MNRAILVKSCQRFRRRQDACSETWVGEFARQNVPIRFIEGAGGKPHFGTALIVVMAGDSYQDNSLKLRDALTMMLDSREKFTHVFICDDDTFVHPKRWLAHVPQGDLECRVFRPVQEADKKRNKGRPWISGGSGWWMSRRLCELYVQECNERTSADDILVARIAAKHGIEMVDRPDLYGNDRYGGKEERVAPDNTLITCHHVQPNEMVQLWEANRQP